MGKSLIITEKPSVAMEFAKILGVQGRNNGYIEDGRYVITWCVGHLVGLSYPEEYDEKYKKWKLEDLPFLPEKYKYNVISSVKDQYKIVHAMLMRKDIDRVYWAGDAGKEGQTIEENIRNFGGVRKGMEELRIWIDSQTEDEIKRGIREAKPMSAYKNLGDSGIMRAMEDYAMGINFSRVLSVKYGNILNTAAGTKSYTAIAVGRVMTCVLGMVVQREREIRSFKETPFYRVVGSFTDGGIVGEWKAVKGSMYYQSPLLYKENGFKNEKDAQKLIEFCRQEKAIVKSLDKTISKKKAPLLFNLAELQAECTKRFKLSPDETLQVAQELYEMKLTTYPRTDARVLSSAVAKEIWKNIEGLKNYQPVGVFAETIIRNKMYSGITGTPYVDDTKISDHYAVIPTGYMTGAGALSPVQRDVFDLICRRFLSIFYPSAEYQTVKLVVKTGSEEFHSTAKTLKTPGFLEITGISQKDIGDAGTEPKVLLNAVDSLKTGQEVKVNGYSIRYGKTTPPKRYTSGSMVLAMENAGQLIEDEELREQIKGCGIGTSATRADIIKKLVRIGYLNLNKKTQVLTPEKLGEMVYEIVNLTVPALLNPKMSASWEKGLDGIAKGKVDFNVYRKEMEGFIRNETVKMINQDLMEELKSRIGRFSTGDFAASETGKKTGMFCPVCGGDIVTTAFGYGCSNYKPDKTGCTFCIGEIAGIKITETQLKLLIEKGATGKIRGFKSKSGKKFDAVLKLDTDEEGNKKVSFEFDTDTDYIDGVTCPDCKGRIKKTTFGFTCENNNRKNQESCRFFIGTVAGKKLTETHIRQLLTEGKTECIRGFKSKAGKKFDASVILSCADGRTGISFQFESKDGPVKNDLSCPKCGSTLTDNPKLIKCSKECGFLLWKTIAGKMLSDMEIKELIRNGRTDFPVKGFMAKSGKKFDAVLKLKEDKTGVEFSF